MLELHYHHVDVFTDQPFGGNQLAVFVEGQAVPEHLMLAITREMNFSETTFLLPPQDPGHDYHLRIFTPGGEVPMAGHPTVGTAFVLQHLGLVPPREGRQTVIFEEGVGPIPVTIEPGAGGAPLITMSQPLPEFGPEFDDREALADMLSITPGDLHAEYPAQVVSSGVPFLYVPVRDLATMHALRLRLDVWEEVLKHWEADAIFAFALETERPTSTVHARMFAPAMNILEDPATGAASGPLGAYLVEHEIVAAGPTAAIVSEQGFEMGRPSLVHITIETQKGVISAVKVGGYSVYMGAGRLLLPADA